MRIHVLSNTNSMRMPAQSINSDNSKASDMHEIINKIK